MPSRSSRSPLANFCFRIESSQLLHVTGCPRSAKCGRWMVLRSNDSKRASAVAVWKQNYPARTQACRAQHRKAIHHRGGQLRQVPARQSTTAAVSSAKCASTRSASQCTSSITRNREHRARWRKSRLRRRVGGERDVTDTRSMNGSCADLSQRIAALLSKHAREDEGEALKTVPFPPCARERGLI